VIDPGFILLGIAVRGTTSDDVSWVAVGDFPTFILTTTTADGSGGWTPAFFEAPGPVDASFKGVAYNGNVWVAVGEDSGKGVIYSTKDPKGSSQWKLIKTVPGAKFAGIAWNGSAWLTADTENINNNNLWYSSDRDATDWLPVSSVSGTALRAIGWNGAAWLAVNPSSLNTIKNTQAIPHTTIDWSRVNSLNSQYLQGVASSEPLPNLS
jgi:hypothetical protein